MTTVSGDAGLSTVNAVNVPDGEERGQPSARGLVLVIEDEAPIAEVERLYLSREGFGVHVERTALAGLAAARRLRPVAILLDVGLPPDGAPPDGAPPDGATPDETRLDGTDVCRSLREEGDWTPVLFVTARDDEVERIRGLELGADDYITKPFSPRELVARLRTVLRRSEGPTEAGCVVLGPVRVDLDSRRVRIDGDEASADVPLTATEFDLLVFLARRPGRVISREELLSSVWGYSAAGGTRTVDVHIAQLRGKLSAGLGARLGPEADLIRTVRGIGYAAGVPGPAATIDES